MSITKKILEFVVKNKGANKSLDDTKNKTSEVTQETEKLNSATGKTPKLLKAVGGGLKVMGTAFKALGIGIVVALVAQLTKSLMKNQAVIDVFNKVLTTLDVIFGSVVDVLVSAFDSLKENTKQFDALKAVVMGLLTIALTPLKLTFFAIKLAIQETRLAWEKSFLGSGDASTIETLNKSIDETTTSIKKVGTDAEQATKDIKDNVGEAANGIVGLVKNTVDGISDIDIAASTAAADRLVELRKNAELAEATLQGSIEQYDILVEKERQIRDDVSLTIESRKEANKEVGKLLAEQAAQETKLANIRVAAAQAEIDAGDTTIEAQKALILAKNEVIAVEARVNGQLSEQRVNREALLQEERDSLAALKQIGLDKTQLANSEAQQLFTDRKQQIERTISSEIEKNELLKLAQQDLNNSLQEIEKENQNELAKIKEEFLPEDEKGLSDAEIFEAERSRKREQFAIKLADERIELEERNKLLAEFDALTDKGREENAKADAERQKAARSLEVDLATKAVSAIAGVLGEGNKIGQGLAAASALMNTYQGITAALKDPTMPSTFARIAAAVSVGIQGFAAVKSILSTDPSGSNVNAGSASTGARVSPTFSNIDAPVGADELDTLPTQVYVTSEEVSSQQALDRQRQRNRRF